MRMGCRVAGKKVGALGNRLRKGSAIGTDFFGWMDKAGPGNARRGGVLVGSVQHTPI